MNPKCALMDGCQFGCVSYCEASLGDPTQGVSFPPPAAVDQSGKTLAERQTTLTDIGGSAMTTLPADSPIMAAWNAYKASPEYANSFRWAEQELHRDGSMWAAFLSGWYAAGAASVPEHEALMRFAGACLEPWPECLYDLEGNMQERLHKSGLTELRTATEPGDDHDIGDEVYYLSDFGKRCRAMHHAATGGEGMSTMQDTCRNCGGNIKDHRLANFADGPHIGANFLVCPRSTFQPQNFGNTPELPKERNTNGGQGHVAAARCSDRSIASSEATCLNAGPSARIGTDIQHGKLDADAGSIPAPPTTSPDHDRDALVRRLRQTPHAPMCPGRWPDVAYNCQCQHRSANAAADRIASDGDRIRELEQKAKVILDLEETIAEQEKERDMWLQVWEGIQQHVPDLRANNKPLAVAASYELLRAECAKLRRVVEAAKAHRANAKLGWRPFDAALADLD